MKNCWPAVQDFSFWFLQVSLIKQYKQFQNPDSGLQKLTNKNWPLSSLQRFQGLPFQPPQAQVEVLQNRNLQHFKKSDDGPESMKGFWKMYKNFCFQEMYH